MFDVSLSLNDERQFTVEIFDDNQFENTENFTLELRFDPFITQPSGVLLDPNMATVYIQDRDSNG